MEIIFPSYDLFPLKTLCTWKLANVVEQLLLGFTGETYGFGDGPNDLHLLEAVDHATAMGNAIDDLKAIADFVSTANTDHGIINAFKHWGWL